MKKALYRKRICAEKEKLTPEKVFHTPQYRDLLTSIGHEITGGKLTTLRLYDDKNSGIAGWNQGETVAVNLGNQITSSFLTLELKSDSLIGILGHECGHYRYTDSALRKRYAEHMLNGNWYPKEPVPENAQEKEALDAMNVYFERKDKAILSIFLQTASYLSNLLNDMYIEEKMCALFPGSIRRGILMNRDRNVEWLPTLREMLETEKDRLSILMNLCAQYALSSRVNAWDGADYELIDTLKLLMPVIDEAGKAADDMERYLATNHILLMICKYFAEIIDEIEKNSTENEEQKPEQEEREGQKENPNESEEEPEEEKQGNTGAQTEQNEDKIRKEDTEQESETEDKTERNGEDQETEGHENGRTAELQKFLQQLCENLPKCVRESGGFEDKQNECGIPASETEASSDNALQKILYEMAKETLDEKIQKEIFEHLQKELMEIPFEEGHDLVQKKLCRKTEISDFLKLQTEKYEGQLKQVKKRLRLKLLPILKNQKERTEHKLFLGRRVDLRNIAAPSGAVFKKQQPGKKLDICVAVLVDNSFSMCGERMDHAILAALCLYDFCMESEIPVLVCGHHTDGYRHENLKDETVYLHCCADFETDEKDRFRIAGMQPYGSNRDGTALWYAGSRLLERPEKQKLLFVISDGAPNANQYGGTGAKRDLQKIRKKLLQQGVFFQAAAIGSDKEAIQEIYEESFLDQNLLNGCSGLPALMDKLLSQDPSWKNLKTELNISDAFVAENKSNIQKFIYEGGAEIMTSFLNRQPKKKEEIRRIVNAELLGKFMELKYHEGDLGREIAFPIKKDTEEIWKEKLLRVDCGWEIWEEDSLLPVMQIGEVPLRSCISYRNGPNCDCLLSCFDANKKIIFIKHNGKIVFRAILRLTKGSFVAADERKTIEFVDVTAKSEPHENKAEELVLFLERYYQSGLSEQEIQKAVNLTVMLVKEKAEKLGARLVLSSSYKNVLENKNYVLTNFYMYISASKNGSQYLDSLGGAAGVSASGSYSCNTFLLEAEERREESL